MNRVGKADKALSDAMKNLRQWEELTGNQAIAVMSQGMDGVTVRQPCEQISRGISHAVGFLLEEVKERCMVTNNEGRLLNPPPNGPLAIGEGEVVAIRKKALPAIMQVQMRCLLFINLIIISPLLTMPFFIDD